MEFLDKYNENNIFTPRNITIMDNLSVYYSERVRDFFLDNNYRNYFLLTYSLKLNLIKEVFAIIKRRYYSKRPIV